MDPTPLVKRFVIETARWPSDPQTCRVDRWRHDDRWLPYFVLEYVEGLNIKRYCDEHKLIHRAA